MKKRFVYLSIIFSFFIFLFSIDNVKAEDETFVLTDETLETINNNNSEYLEIFKNLTVNYNYYYILFKARDNKLYLIRSKNELNSLSFYSNKIGHRYYLDNYTQYTIVDINDLTNLNWVNTGELVLTNSYENIVYLTTYKYIAFDYDSHYNSWAIDRSIDSYRTARYYINQNEYFGYGSAYSFLSINDYIISPFLKNGNLSSKLVNAYQYQTSISDIENQDILDFINNENNFNDIDLDKNYIIYTGDFNRNSNYWKAGINLITFSDNIETIYTKSNNNNSAINFYYTSSNNYYKRFRVYTLRQDSNNNFFWSIYSHSAYNETNTGLPYYPFYGSNDNLMGKIYKSTINILDGDNGYVEIFHQNTTPTMSLKASYNSNENDLGEIGKVTVNFSEHDITIDDFHYVLFRLQFISNDVTEENIPIFSHFKLYGKTIDAGNDADYEEVDLDEFKLEIEDEQGNVVETGLNFEIIDTQYDYVPSRMAMSMLDFKLSFLENANTKYDNWKIEFYFDNGQNATINVFDSLETSTWRNEPKFLNEYDFYYFPSNYKYAYISSANQQNTGKVYFPTNSIKNPQILLQGQYFNIENKDFSAPLEPILYTDNYYSYIDFEFDSTEKLFTLNRAYGKEKNEQHLLYGTNFLEYIKNNIMNNFKIIEEYDREITYFYVPKGYTVVFSDGKSNFEILTANGMININEKINKNLFEVDPNNTSVTVDGIIDRLLNITKDATSPLDIIKNIYSIFRNSYIGNYVFIVIITSMLILIVKALRR